MNWDWDAAEDAMPDLLDGLVTALQATVVGYLIALVLGLVFALARRAPSPWINVPVGLLVEFIRSTPLLVQLFFLFYVLPTLPGEIQMSAFTCGAVGLGVHYATYLSEVYRAAIDDVPAAQWEAATALNLPRQRVWTSVILPQAIPRAIPAMANYVIAIFKDTPVLTGITVLEMLTSARDFGSETFRYTEAITLAGLLYLACALVMSYVARILERRFGTVRV